MTKDFDTHRAAKAYKDSGFKCAESALLALADKLGINNELLPQVASCFCTGMAGNRGTCGALTGAMMGLGLALGRTRSESQRSVTEAYEATTTLIKSFEEEFGAKDCHLLVGCDLGTEEGQAFFKAHNLGERCSLYTARAAEIADKILVEKALV